MKNSNLIKLPLLIIVVLPVFYVVLPSFSKYMIMIGFIAALFNGVFLGSKIKIEEKNKFIYYNILIILLSSILSFCRIYLGGSEFKTLKDASLINIILLITILMLFIFKNNLSELIYKMNTYKYINNLFALICFVNVLFLIMGIKGISLIEASEPNTMLSLFGINVDRQKMPLANFYNTVAVMASFVLINGLTQIKNLNLTEICFFIIIPALNLILPDSRGAMVSIIISFAFFHIMNRGYLKIILILTVIFFVANTIDLDALDSILIRDGGGTIFTGREVMWGSALIEIMDFKLIHLYGYGAWGQHASGVWDLYEYFWRYLDGHEGVSLHNSYLQLIIDQGYVGFFSYTLLVIYLIKRQNKLSNDINNNLILVIFFMYIYGFIELSLLFYHEWNLIIFCAVFAGLLSKKGLYKS